MTAPVPEILSMLFFGLALVTVGRAARKHFSRASHPRSTDGKPARPD